MTENKEKPSDLVAIHKITGDRVEIGLAEFITMVNAVRAAKATEEANEWLRKARANLLQEIEYTRTEQRPKAPASIVVYRRAPNGSLHVQFIEGMQQGQDGTIYITIGEPQ